MKAEQVSNFRPADVARRVVLATTLIAGVPACSSFYPAEQPSVTVGGTDGVDSFDPRNGKTLNSRLDSQSPAVRSAMQRIAGPNRDCYFIDHRPGIQNLLVGGNANADKLDIICRDKVPNFEVAQTTNSDGEPGLPIVIQTNKTPRGGSGLDFIPQAEASEIPYRKVPEQTLAEAQQVDRVEVPQQETVFSHETQGDRNNLGIFTEGFGYGVGSLPNTLLTWGLGGFNFPQIKINNDGSQSQEVNNKNVNDPKFDNSPKFDNRDVNAPKFDNRDGGKNGGKNKKYCPPKKRVNP